MGNFTLFFANAIIAAVFAAAFFAAGIARKEAFWRSWSLASAVIALALLAFMFAPRFPDLFIVTVPNCLLVLGMSLKWYGARQFEARELHSAIVWGPSTAFLVLCAVPSVYGSYAAVYAIVNVLLAFLTAASAWEFWRAREKLPAASRYGMVLAFAVLALSFAVRAGQGVWSAGEMARQLPDDFLLMVHLSVALLHLAASGAFLLSLAYERDAARLSWMASHDDLTALSNRGAFEERAAEYLRGHHGHDVAILMVDIDHFKQINDRYGHAGGDEALKACALVLKETLGDKCLIARWGGEEFVVMLWDISAEDVRVLTEHLRQQVKQLRVPLSGARIRMSASFGICHRVVRSSDLALLIRAADAALYCAKANGRDRYEVAAAA